jgi:ribosome maturation protein SDO1
MAAERCVDPTTGRPHTVGIIEKAMAEIHFKVGGTKVAKGQVGDCIAI